MSEEKVVKHTAKAVHIVMDKKLSWKKKIKEVALEILIIVFAVSITLMFHNWNDKSHENQIEREFLIGIKGDLKTESDKLDANVKYFQPTVDYYNAVLKQINLNKIDTQYVDKNSWQLTNTSYYVADNGRFESFKSSGYLRLIRNQELAKDLMSLFTISIPFQEEIDKNLYSKRSNDYDTYIGSKGISDSGTVHVSKLFNDPAVRYQVLRYANSFNERKTQQAELANQIRGIINEIDKQLEK
jgi:hypothetical protein